MTTLESTIHQMMEGLRQHMPSEAEVEAYEREQAAKNRDKLLIESGLPEAFWTHPQWSSDQRDAIKKLWAPVSAPKPRKGAVVIMAGYRGTGKTSIAGALIVKFCREGHECLYKKMADLGELRLLYNAQGYLEENMKGALERRSHLCNVRLLAIDEMHEAVGMSADVLTDVVDRRYANGRDTFLISNHLPSELSRTVNASILDRAKECGGVIAFDWGSFRDTKHYDKNT